MARRWVDVHYYGYVVLGRFGPMHGEHRSDEPLRQQGTRASCALHRPTSRFEGVRRATLRMCSEPQSSAATTLTRSASESTRIFLITRPR